MSFRARRTLITLTVGSAVLIGACGGGTAPGQSSAPGSTVAPGGGQSAAPPPAGGTETVRVVITGGPDAGTYTTTANPNCSNGIFGTGGWGVQYSTADLTGAKDFTSLQLVHWPGDPDPEGMFADTKFLMTVVIGPLLEGRTLDVKVLTNASESLGEGSASVQEGNPTIITATGTTADGVKIDATITCPTVIRA